MLAFGGLDAVVNAGLSISNSLLDTTPEEWDRQVDVMARGAHQVRLLAVELGEHGIRVNGVNPDGVVRGSGMIFPEHVAAAVFALVSGNLPVTTGTLIPVDGGVPSAFLR